MKEPHFIFGPDFATDGVNHHAVSIYMNSSIMTILLELVKEQGELSLHCTKDGFQISIGEYEFTVTQQTDFFKISLLNQYLRHYEAIFRSWIRPRVEILSQKVELLIAWTFFGSNLNTSRAYFMPCLLAFRSRIL